MPEFRIPNSTSSLKKHPKIAELLGVYISTFAVLELECLKLFSCITGASEDVGHIILHQFSSVSHRLQVLEDLAEHISEENKNKKKCQELVARIAQANSFRNHVAHSIYAIDATDENKLHYVMHATRKRPRPASRPVDAQEIENEISKVELLLADIGQLQLPGPRP